MSVFLTHDSTLRNTFLKDVNPKQWFSAQLITGVLEGALTHVQIPRSLPWSPRLPSSEVGLGVCTSPGASSEQPGQGTKNQNSLNPFSPNQKRCFHKAVDPDEGKNPN